MCDAVDQNSLISKEFQHISEFVDLPEERNTCIVKGNDIWFFGQKFVDQPTFNYGHHVSFAGDVHATRFDATTSHWESPAKKMGAATEALDENLNEIIFVFRAQIFLFLYTAFGPIRSISLHKFDDQTGQWANASEVEISLPPASSAPDNPNPNRLILVDGEWEGGVYFVDANSNIYRFTILENSTSLFEQIGTFNTTENSSPTMRVQPTVAALIFGSEGDNAQILAQGGVHGCGFHYQQQILLRFNLTEKSSQITEINGDEHPLFRFSGALVHAGAFPSPNAWTLFGGLRSIGMSDSKFDGAIWTLENADGDAPKWRKCDAEIPQIDRADIAKSSIVIRRESRELFLFSPRLGAMKLRL